MGRVAKGEDALFRSTLLLVSPRPAKRRVEAVLLDRLSASVFITWVCSEEPESNGLMPFRTPSSLT